MSLPRDLFLTKSKLINITMKTTEQKILQKLEQIENELKSIKEYMIDMDMILTEEEKELVEKSIRHEREGRLISIDEVECSK
ncbi:MAG: hypothetical protein DRO94_02765 [Candidatus Altiarchaeales archaeon]|nr:MAG: hypothetical protein DRO94_02765 [Candidatus Altiarchaeales archaeon]HDO82298.1 hypothetical protein [Candidatus Altiarchaeales archaeon]HEX54947.1 hypothetical protein [Candidatus Altiarchaeales archaeon]